MEVAIKSYLPRILNIILHRTLFPNFTKNIEKWNTEEWENRAFN